MKPVLVGSAKPPQVAVAAFCERVLQEIDGTLSAIRIIDRVTADLSSVSATQIPGAQITILIALKYAGGDRKGSVQVVANAPSGRRLAGDKVPIEFRGDQTGANVVINTMLALSESGLHWFDVQFEGDTLTRMPLDVILLRRPSQDESPSRAAAQPAGEKPPSRQ